MILTTTPTIQGHNIETYYGIVTSEVIIGANVVKDFFGGRAGSYENVLVEAKEQAIKELQQRAAAMGANAVVGIDLDFETVGETGSMLMVSVSGTAVKIS